MTPLRLILLWLLIVAAFVSVGFLYADHPFKPPDGPEPVIAFGGLVIGVALCVLAGLFIFHRVRARRMPRFLAAALLLVSSALSILVPVPIIRAAALATPYRGSEVGYHLFQGEQAQWVFIVFYGFWIALAAFVMLDICVFSVGRSKAQPGSCTGRRDSGYVIYWRSQFRRQ